MIGHPDPNPVAPPVAPEPASPNPASPDPDPSPDPQPVSPPQSGQDDAPCRTVEAATEGGAPVEVGGRDGPDPTRYGDWEKNGRCIDF